MYLYEQWKGERDAAAMRILHLQLVVAVLVRVHQQPGALQVFVKGVEVFSPFGHIRSLGYKMTDRYAED